MGSDLKPYAAGAFWAAPAGRSPQRVVANAPTATPEGGTVRSLHGGGIAAAAVDGANGNSIAFAKGPLIGPPSHHSAPRTATMTLRKPFAAFLGLSLLAMPIAARGIGIKVQLLVDFVEPRKANQITTGTAYSSTTSTSIKQGARIAISQYGSQVSLITPGETLMSDGGKVVLQSPIVEGGGAVYRPDGHVALNSAALHRRHTSKPQPIPDRAAEIGVLARRRCVCRKDDRAACSDRVLDVGAEARPVLA